MVRVARFILSYLGYGEMDARLKEGIGLFNAGRFFESHESLEDLYLDTDEEHKPFLEGLVQLSAACRIFHEFGEITGPVRMVRQAIIRLENYKPSYLGIRVKSLIHSMEEWSNRMEAAEPNSTVPRLPTPKIRLCWFFTQ